MRGFLAGTASGFVVAGVGLSALSLMAPQPAGNRPPEAPLVEAPAEVAADVAAEPGAAPPAAEAGAAPTEAPAQGEPLPAPDVATAPAADTSPAAVPVLADAAPEPGAPPTAADTVALAVAGDAAPDGLAARTAAPAVPPPETEVVAATEPATPAPVAAESAPEAEAPVTAALPEPAPVLAEETGAAPPTEAAEAAPAQPVLAAPEGGAPEIAAESAPDLPESVAGIAPPPTDATAPEVATEVEAPIEGGLDLPQIGVEEDLPDLPADPAALPGANGAQGLPGAGSGVRVNRPETGTPAVEEPVAEPALLRHAARWDGPDLPRMGLVLVDAGALDGGVPGAAAAAVAALPLTVTVAIDPARPGAGEAMAAYRAAGIEVLALARLPEGAAVTDVAVAMEGARAALPEAVGLVDTGAGGLQGGREVTAQVMARLAAEGMGVVLPGGGIGGAAAAATEAGVPVAEIWREIPPEADAAAIRRLLDQGAFRARQDSGVVLVGEVGAETVSALMLWGATRAAEQVALAPVSVILRGE